MAAQKRKKTISEIMSEVGPIQAAMRRAVRQATGASARSRKSGAKARAGRKGRAA